VDKVVGAKKEELQTTVTKHATVVATAWSIIWKIINNTFNIFRVGLRVIIMLENKLLHLAYFKWLFTIRYLL
jgi:hypothetical protein